MERTILDFVEFGQMDTSSAYCAVCKVRNLEEGGTH